MDNAAVIILIAIASVQLYVVQPKLESEIKTLKYECKLNK